MPASSVPAQGVSRPIHFKTMSEFKVALVTGGASGLGRAAALLFAAKGCQVCIADVQDDKGHEICKDIEGEGSNAHCYYARVITLSLEVDPGLCRVTALQNQTMSCLQGTCL